MTSLPDQRYETARDHLLQALAIIPAEGSETVRLLIEEAARRCEELAYRDALPPLPLSPGPKTRL